MLDRNTSYLIYARTCTVCASVEIYENYFKMKKEINKRKQNEFSAAAQKVPKFLPRQRIISPGPLYVPGLKGVPPARSSAATCRAISPGW